MSDQKTSLPDILERFKARSEACCKRGIPHRAVGYRDGEGYFHPATGTPKYVAAGRGEKENGDPLTCAEAKAIASELNESERAKEAAGTAGDQERRQWDSLHLSTARLTMRPRS